MKKKKKHQKNARRPQAPPAWRRKSCALTTLQCAPPRFVFLGPLEAMAAIAIEHLTNGLDSH